MTEHLNGGVMKGVFYLYSFIRTQVFLVLQSPIEKVDGTLNGPSEQSTGPLLLGGHGVSSRIVMLVRGWLGGIFVMVAATPGGITATATNSW